MDVQTKIRDFITKNLLFSDNGFGYTDDDSFLQEGIIDSVGVMDLILFVEENFDVVVDDQEITPDNFDSVNKLTDYIHHKLGVAV